MHQLPLQISSQCCVALYAHTIIVIGCPARIRDLQMKIATRKHVPVHSTDQASWVQVDDNDLDQKPDVHREAEAM